LSDVLFSEPPYARLQGHLIQPGETHYETESFFDHSCSNSSKQSRLPEVRQINVGGTCKTKKAALSQEEPRDAIMPLQSSVDVSNFTAASY